MKAKSTFIYLLAAISAAFIWGFITIPLKRLHHLNYTSEQILYYRVLTSLVLLWIYNLAFRAEAIKKDIVILKSLPPQNRKKVLWLLAITGIAITGNWYTYIYVVNHISVKVAASAYLICPLLTAAGGFIILKEELSKFKLAGIIVAILSIIILSTGSVVEVLWSAIVAIFYAVYLIIQRLLTRFDKVNMLAVQLIISALLLLPFYLKQFNGLPNQPAFWLNIVVLAALFTIAPLLLSLLALTGIPSSTLGITIYINPVITFAVAFVYFDEMFTKSQLSGYLLLLVSVIIFNWEMISIIFKKKSLVQKQLT